MRTKHCGLWFGLAAFVLSVIPMEAGAESGLDLATLNVHPETKMWVNPTWRGRAAGVEIETGKVFGRNAFAEGVGEALQPVELAPAWYVVLEPPVQVPTAAIFGAPDLKRDSAPMRATDWRPGIGGNDLEAVAVARFPAVAEYLRWLSRFAEARMSGSGACVFAGFADKKSAEAVIRKLPPAMRGWLATGLAQHPLANLG